LKAVVFSSNSSLVSIKTEGWASLEFIGTPPEGVSQCVEKLISVQQHVFVGRSEVPMSQSRRRLALQMVDQNKVCHNEGGIGRSHLIWR
jgi:hypothetical protein